MAPPMSSTYKRNKMGNSNPYGSNYILTMNTIHKKTTLATNIGSTPMMRFLEYYVHDLYNSEYKHLLGRNQDRAEAVILVQNRFWEEWEKSGGDISAAAGEFGLRDGQIATLYANTGQDQTTGKNPSFSKLKSEVESKQKKRKRILKVLEDERELKRQRMETAEALAAKMISSTTVRVEDDSVEEHPMRSPLRFLPSPSITNSRVPSPPVFAPNAPLHQCQPKKRPVFINRDRKCIAHARSYLEVLVRNSRSDQSRSDSDESDGYSSDGTNTETYTAEDSAILLGLRLHPLNASDAKEIIDGIAKNEAIMKAGYRGEDLKKVAQEYEAGKKRLARTLVNVVLWDVGMRVEDEARRLVDQVLRY